MSSFRTSWLPILLALIILGIITAQLFIHSGKKPKASSPAPTYREDEGWRPPDTNAISTDAEGDLIRYGRALIANTAFYLGPKGIVAQKSNGMNCQNCHINAGTRLLANPFSAVASTYPKHRDRSGRLESVEYRVNECMERSLNGQPLDSTSLEMRAMVAYLKWVGQGVPRGVQPPGSGVPEVPPLDRPADPQKGKAIYEVKCGRCHGDNGQGVRSPDGVGYTYPPLWGPNSYNVSAGMYRLTRLAGYVWHNMPFDSAALGYRLSPEEAWDVSAYVNSQPRPEKFFPYDWPNIAKKPADHPFGPYADSFTEEQHKYGPFEPIRKAKAARRH